MSDPATTTCPGCHFGCRLERYQCGRGKEFYDLAMDGREVPERRWPMFTPSELAAGRDKQPFPLDERVMRGLGIMSGLLQKRHEQAGERKVAMTLAHGGGFMSLGILGKRTQLERLELDRALLEAQIDGLVALEAEEHAGQVARLTQAGRKRADAWEAERSQKSAEFLAPLDDAEKSQLDALLMKLASAHRPHPARSEQRAERQGSR